MALRGRPNFLKIAGKTQVSLSKGLGNGVYHQKKTFSTGWYDRPKNSVMWSAQDKVPRLPIPTIEETLERYLECVQPLVSADQFAKTQRLTEQFKNGEAHNLQKELINLDKESPTSWLEGFWDSMYLEIRDPIFINSNPYLVLTHDKQRPNQVARAANLVLSCLDVFGKIRENTLTPDFERKEPLDMSQYKKLFASARIPRSGRDLCLTYPDSQHIVVMSQNHFYKVNVLDDRKKPINEGELQKQLNYILNDVSKSKPVDAVGYFTGDEREPWAKVRQQLVNGPNAEILSTVDQAILILNLDNFSPKNWQDAGTFGLHSDGSNRWFDKFQVYVCADGSAGVNFEHTPVDGHSVLRMWMEDFEFRKQPAVPLAKEASATSSLGSVKKLEWNLDNSQKTALKEATGRVKKLIDTTQSSVLIWEKFGKNGITEVKASPDAFVQMAFQLAYFKLYQHPDSTYESANTKRFLAGRTETVRTVSNESLAFTKLWESSAPLASKAAALRAAMDKHGNRANFCKNGRGVDRHLWVLSKLARFKKQRLPDRVYNFPEFFADPSFSTLLTSVLSTSNVSAPCFDLFGFGPVVGNGLGLAYCIHDQKVAFHVTSFIGEAKNFSTKLEQSLDEMRSTLSKN